MMTKKQTYVCPSIEVIEMEHEGVMALSADFTNITPGESPGIGFNRSPYGGAVNNDFEDMINDILTFE